ncbi:ribosomal protein S2 [Aspergillus heteromorphus CBS 117.55]|uniref:Ribosomal protein S2 n=1 Tax=Aspergillus heteromorphus CBS 117.55 TaxID=1448321 RepID=A0A317VPI6_9EURO|nr:ribosomal protein S2 [Aspergillus heteromorphus CBS 117.55]PWY76266.1 ribosomal protein S2 [Aspergillus heteromorphus CBS 117.55]
MIVRQLCLRQARQLRALPRQSRILSRFSSTETTVETAVKTPVRPSPVEPGTSSGFSATEVEAYQQKVQNKHVFHSFGSKVSGAYRPESIIRSPPKPSEVTLELLLACQTHLGHSTSRWNPQNSRYIYGVRDGIHILSLDLTAAHLRRAAKVVEEVSARGGLVLFVGTRKGQKRTVVRAAELAGAYHLFERWIPGSLTNGQQILGHCEKKLVNPFDEQVHMWENEVEEYPALKPDLVVCLNPLENEVLLHECGLNNVPTIGVIDTDANPTSVTYPIPSNDDSLRAVGLIAGVLGRAGQAGQKRRLEEAQKGNLTYERMAPLVSTENVAKPSPAHLPLMNVSDGQPVEAASAAPSAVEPARTEAVSAEAASAELSSVELASAEAAGTEAASAEAANAEPTIAERGTDSPKKQQ